MEDNLKKGIAGVILGAAILATGAPEDQAVKNGLVGQDVQLASSTIEALEVRSWNMTSVPNRVDAVVSDSWLLPEHIDDIRVTQWSTSIAAGQVNFLDSTGEWEEIDTDFIATSTGFEMTKATFAVHLPAIASETAELFHNLRWNNSGKKAMQSPPNSMFLRARDALPVPGRIETGDISLLEGLQKDVNYVVYDNAFGDGIDLIYYVNQAEVPRLEKLIRFHKTPSVFQYAFDLGYDTETPEFRRIVNGVNTRWAERGDLAVPKGSPLMISVSEERGIRFGEFKIWDSDTAYLEGPSGVRNIQNIDTKISKMAPGWYTITKILPEDFFASAVYPVYTDTTTTVYPNEDTETVSVDGTSRAGNTNFTTVRNATDGSSAFDSNASGYLSVGKEGSTYNIYPYFLLFDTSGIPDTDVISAASLNVYRAGDNNANLLGVLTQTSPAANTAITTADYDQRGHTGSEGASNRPDFGTGATTGVVTFTLNATGMGWISKTGITKLGITGSHDFDNSAPTTNPYSQVYFAEQSGTSNDPNLVITHDAAVRRILISDDES